MKSHSNIGLVATFRGADADADADADDNAAADDNTAGGNVAAALLATGVDESCLPRGFLVCEGGPLLPFMFEEQILLFLVLLLYQMIDWMLSMCCAHFYFGFLFFVHHMERGTKKLRKRKK